MSTRALQPAFRGRARLIAEAALRGWVVPVAVLVLGWVGLTLGNRWFVNPDGVIYASLAERMAAGDLTGAVTGYWAPLLPGLAAPLVWLGVAPMMALRLVLLVAAVASLLVVRTLCQRVCTSELVAGLATLLALPLLGVAAVFGIYPDLLLCALLLLVVHLVLNADRPKADRSGVDRPRVDRSGADRWGYAVAAGVAGAAAYLAKPVALLFVGGFVLIVLVVRLLADRSAFRPLLRFHLLVLVVCAVVAAPWVIAISLQVGHLTISTSGAFNARLVTPGAWGNPLSFPGLYRPVAPAVSPWEQPGLLPVRHNASSTAGPVTLLDRAENVYRQGRVAVGSLLRRWTPVVLLALAGLVVAIRRVRAQGQASTSEPPRVVLGCLLAAAMFAGGMSLIVVVERYLWFPMLVVVPVAAVALDAALGWWRDRAGSLRWAVLVGAALVLAVAAGVASVGVVHWGQDRQVWRLAEELNASAPLDVGGPEVVERGLAGDSDWQRSQLLAYLCRVDYRGLTGPDRAPAAQLAQLRAAGAGYLVVWAPAGGTVFDVGVEGLKQHARR